MQIQNNIREDNLRLEIAELIEPIEDADVRNPCKGKFKININMPKAATGTITIPTNNVINKKKTGNVFGASTITSTEYIEITIPEYIKVCMTGEKAEIPAGTKFIIGYPGANNNTPKIVGLYGIESFSNILYTFYETQLKLKQLTLRMIKLEKLHNIKYEGPLIGGEIADGM